MPWTTSFLMSSMLLEAFSKAVIRTDLTFSNLPRTSPLRRPENPNHSYFKTRGHHCRDFRFRTFHLVDVSFQTADLTGHVGDSVGSFVVSFGEIVDQPRVRSHFPAMMFGKFV